MPKEEAKLNIPLRSMTTKTFDFLKPEVNPLVAFK
jgi:hypothetical protein